MTALSPSNRRSVVPGGWRVEVSPARPAREDLFLHALEIGDRDAPPRVVAAIDGHRLAGAAVGNDAVLLFATQRPLAEAEATVPDVATRALVLVGLEPRGSYELQLTSSFAPGAPAWSAIAGASEAGVLRLPWTGKDGRLRVRRIAASKKEESR